MVSGTPNDVGVRRGRDLPGVSGLDITKIPKADFLGIDDSRATDWIGGQRDSAGIDILWGIFAYWNLF